jgi:hypothetical protein
VNGGEVTFNINAENDDAKKKIEETGQSAVEMGDKVADSIKKIVGALALAKGVDFLADISKQCIQAYADFEQLVGGVETLFGDASDTIRQNAAQAFQTVGMSANEYMETVTGFSASLIQSLDGDTAAAAEKADRAITDMSDNANKMGSDIASIQNAYQGFAKQNYTMLDNLKLGYGGTKEEMERLLADAQAISGIKYDVSSYADIIDAIGVIQDKMGITGTTAKEASETISGSIASMKAAWQNLLTGIADPEQSVADLTRQLTDSIQTVEQNIMPRLTEIFGNMGDTIGNLAQGVFPMIPQAISALLPSVVDGLSSILDAVITNGADLAAAIIDYLPKFADSVGQIAGDLVPVLKQAASTIADGVADNADEIVESLIDNIVSFLQNDFPGMTTAAFEQAKKIILAIVHGIVDHAPELAQAAPEIVSTLITELISLLPEFIAMGDEICNSIAEGIVNYDWARAIAALNNGMADILDTAQKNVQVALDNMFSGGALYGGDINNVESTPFIQNMRQGTDILCDTIDESTAKWREAYAAGRTEIDKTLYEPRQVSHRGTDYPLIAEMSGYASSLKAQAEGWAQDAKDTANSMSAAGEMLDSALSDLENKYAIHQVSEEQYWARRKAILEQYRDESDAEWWKLYDQVTAHYDKLAETEAKAAKDAADKAAREAEKAERDKQAALKKSVEDTFRDLETQQMESNGALSKEWLWEQENAFIESLDHDSDLYKDYHHKLLKEKESFTKDAAKETDKTIENERKAMEKLLTSVENAQKNLTASIQTSAGDLFRTDSLKDARTGETVQKKSLDIADFEKKLEAKRKLTSKIADLLDAGVSDELVRELLKLDPTDALQFASQLLANPTRLDRIKADFAEDKAVSERLSQMVVGSSEDYAALGKAAGDAFGEGFIEALGSDWQEDLKKIIGDENMYKGVLATIGGIGAMSTMFGQAAGGVQTAQAMTVNVRGVMTDEDGRVVGSIVNRDNERTNTSAGV